MDTAEQGWRWVRQRKCSRAGERLADVSGGGLGQTRTSSATLAIWALAVCGLLSAATADGAPAKVLLLSGQNNHAWDKTTPALVGILGEAGGYSVEVVDAPQDLDPARLKDFDVIVSNWNAWGPKGSPAAVADWPVALKKAYVGFVASGGGHVVVHAGSSSFEGWEDYRRICGATWGLGQTSHGPPHEFEVRIDDPSHPITQGLAPFRTTDELWNRPRVQPGFRVIASSFSGADRKGTGNWEPTVIVGTFGRGRCCALLLGHDAAAMANGGFKALFHRGVAWAAEGKTRAAAGKDVPPSVVLFLADDLGYGDIGAHGNDRVKTPNIDAFARDSVELAQYRVSPVCSPTRASLLTGRYSFRGGVCDVFGKACELDPAEVTLAEALRASGYATGIFGKWHLGADEAHSPNAQGFDEALYAPGPAIPTKEYFDPDLRHNGQPEERKGYCMDVFADAAIDFMRQNRDRPFFVYLPANLIHTPLVVADELSKPFLEAGVSESTAKIYGMIRSVDSAFGRVRSALEELGIAKDTLLIFTSDNGPCSGSKPLDRDMAGLHGLKGTVYDNGIRVPCFARWPKGFASPGKVDRQTAHIDIMPTVLEVCGAAAPAGVSLDGRSLMPLLRQPSIAWDDRELFFQWDSGQRPRRGSAYAVLTDRWKLVQPVGMDAANQQHIRDRYAELCRLQGRGERSIEGKPRHELYAIKDDPGEAEDLAARHADVVDGLRRRYEAWYDDVCSRWIPGGKAVPALRGWSPDQGLAPLNAAARAVQAVANDPAGRAEVAEKLAALLAESLPGGVKKFICEQLAVVGGEDEVVALGSLLDDEVLETSARGALERIGGEAAAGALRLAYERAKPPARRAGLLGSLVKLRDAQAVPFAKEALGAEDAALREAALVALGDIGGESAVDALLGAEGKLPEAQRLSWGSALLACAEVMGAETESLPAARQALNRLVKEGQPSSIRAAAFAAKVRFAGEAGPGLAVETLRGQDVALRRGALDALGEGGARRLRVWGGEVAAAFGGLTSDVRVELLDTYGAHDIRLGAALAAAAVGDKDPAVRHVGLRVLGALGSEPDFDLLFRHLAGDATGDRAAAADGLAKLRAGSTDGRLIALLPSVPTPVVPAVIDVLVRRGARSAVPALLHMARGSDSDTAKAAVKAIGELGNAAEIPGLADVISRGGPASGSAAQLLARIARAEPEAAKVRLAAAMALVPVSARETLAKILALVDGSAVTGSADVPGLGRNLALGAKAESTTGLKADGGAAGPGAAVDGDPGTYWDEQNDQPEYRLRITLKQAAKISRIRITGYRQHDYAPKDFSVVCDGREVKKVVGAEYSDNRVLLEFPPTQCQAVEFVITGYFGGSPAIRELEIFGDARPGSGGKAAPAAPGLSWEKGEGSVGLLLGGNTVWRLLYGAGQPFPHFDSLGLAGGENLVWKSPPDHVHHYAHWYSWKVINGVNYWEFDKATGRPVGETRCSDVSAETRPDGSARISMRLSYAPPGGKPVLSEDRILDISAPAADGGYRIDWRMEWAAGDETVVLDRTPPPGEPDGKAHGGYAGLSVRFAKDFSDWTVVDSEGAQGMEGHRKRAAASDFSGKIAGRECGVAILDHPKNTNAPTPWFYVINPQVPFGYTNPAYLCDSPKRIEAGGKLLLRYRVILHAGRWDVAALREASAAYPKEVP